MGPDRLSQGQVGDTPRRLVLAGSRPWSRHVYEAVRSRVRGDWTLVRNQAELKEAVVSRTPPPRYVFFVHWSWRVPQEILDRSECVCFHMTDVPYGRGGSPLQNLIVRGHRSTVLTALRMVEDLDAGPVYLKEPLSLEGLAEEIYLRAGRLSGEMIVRIVEGAIVPAPQTGLATVFPRRTPADSVIPPRRDVSDLHDFLRMLDADGYPRAYLVHEGFVYRFSRPALYDGRIMADVTITPVGDGDAA
jgi:methionyl-tRNA formyltransferase